MKKKTSDTASKRKKNTWGQIKKTLTSKDKLALIALAIIVGGSLLALLFQKIYYSGKVEVAAFGGTYTEGVIGTPRLINPTLAQTNEADLDLTQLLFSRLFTYDEKGELINDLAKNYTLNEDGTVITVELRDNATFHDGEKVTAEDILFTLQIIQDPTYESPLRPIWQGVTVKQENEQTLTFTLKDAFAPFQHNLTFGILPKHIWDVIDAKSIKQASQNTKPMGSGPYQFTKLKKNKEGRITQIELEHNPEYYGIQPYLERIIIKYYKTEEELIDAFNKKEVDHIAGISAENIEMITRKDFQEHQLLIPQYFSLFLNPLKKPIFKEAKIRTALASATNKKAIIEHIFKNKASLLESPIPSGIFAHTDDLETTSYNPEEAKKLLDEAGYKDLNNDGLRSKIENDEETEETLSITLTTSNWPNMIQVAEKVKEQWQEVGVQVQLEILKPSDIQTTRIRPREYDILLFGEIASPDPDLFAFWHSSQVKDPGLNLAIYENGNVDKIIEEARQEQDKTKRETLYKEAQQKIASDLPAIFLYQTSYNTISSKNIHGEETASVAIPSHRFSDIAKRYIKTTHVKPENQEQN